MSNPAPNISIQVDHTNPGQFFACCGMLELADRLWPGAEGWFDRLRCTFQIAASPAASLRDLLVNAMQIQFQIGTTDTNTGDEDEDDHKELIEPILVTSPVTLRLDWWSDKSIKPWAGSMKERLILDAMLGAIDPANADPFNDAKRVFDRSRPKPGNKKRKKREPFYFEVRQKKSWVDSGSGSFPSE
jgi:hypothetical protein